MGRILALVYGVVAYVLCLGTLVYAIGFISDFVVPKTVDAGGTGPTNEALIIDTLLLLLFAVQHSVWQESPSRIGGRKSFLSPSNAAHT